MWLHTVEHLYARHVHAALQPNTGLLLTGARVVIVSSLGLEVPAIQRKKLCLTVSGMWV